MTHAPDADLTPKQQYNRAHYQANKQKWVDDYLARYDFKKARREQGRQLLNELKDVPCMDCGGRFPPECMDFDHRNPKAKRCNVAQMVAWTPENIFAEVAKCDIICANCHRIRTFRGK